MRHRRRQQEPVARSTLALHPHPHQLQDYRRLDDEHWLSCDSRPLQEGWLAWEAALMPGVPPDRCSSCEINPLPRGPGKAPPARPGDQHQQPNDLPCHTLTLRVTCERFTRTDARLRAQPQGRETSASKQQKLTAAQARPAQQGLHRGLPGFLLCSSHARKGCCNTAQLSGTTRIIATSLTDLT